MKKQSGMALVAVMVMLVIMMTIGTAMYKLVQSTIGVSGSYYRKATTRGVGVAAASMLVSTVADSVRYGDVTAPTQLQVGSTSPMFDMLAAEGNDILSDTAESSPDFTFNVGDYVATADVDFMQTIPLAGGSVEFASAYDGVGQGMTLGTSFVIEDSVQILSRSTVSGARTIINFVTVQ
jgi:hypothetical protein